MIYGITLIILGLLAAPSLILSKRPDAQQVLDKIAPYQGWIGVVFCFWGIWGVIVAILNVGWMSLWPIWWVSLLAGSLVQAALGFLLGYGLINQFLLSKNEQAKAKAEQLLAKLAPIQGKLGLVGIAVGSWMIVANLMFFSL